MYQDHFQLRESPFGITPNPAFFYSGNTRGEILEALLYAVCHGEGIVKVTGEVGAGKTMLCRMLESQLPEHIEVIYLVNPNLNPVEVQFAIAAELGLPTRGFRVDEVQRGLHAHLIARHGQGQQVVLLVEEAQAMPLDTLEAIRLLTNLETARSKLLQIVLFGQPELDDHLELSSMRQLRERITHSFHVPAMAPDLVAEFLDFRLRAAGRDGPSVFSATAARLIADESEGIVRRINILADKALLAAFADDADVVGKRHVKLAIRESPFGRRGRAGRNSRNSNNNIEGTLLNRRPRNFWLRSVAIACLLSVLIGAIWLGVLAVGQNL
jgi:type II secretory pathway predicted ATPase ExeA